MALRILEAKKSKYYAVALERLGEARRIMDKEGQAPEWEALAAEIRRRHRLKKGFLAGFARLVEPGGAREPSFLDRARKRWDHGTRNAP